MTVAAGLALAEALDDAGVPGVSLKWPNDCLVGGRKLAGILAQALPDAGAVLVGVGINGTLDPAALPPELADRVEALDRVLPAGVAADATCADALERIAAACGAAGDGALLDPGRVARFLAIGRLVDVAGRRGRVRGVAPRGALVLAIGDEDVEVDVGEVCDAGGD
jgi:BirA family biotin operon repressor/biotin-[acetyl-CoA-carboxylase] ligase